LKRNTRCLFATPYDSRFIIACNHDFPIRMPTRPRVTEMLGGQPAISANIAQVTGSTAKCG
jgi:hypothetical protein